MSSFDYLNETRDMMPQLLAPNAHNPMMVYPRTPLNTDPVYTHLEGLSVWLDGTGHVTNLKDFFDVGRAKDKSKLRFTGLAMNNQQLNAFPMPIDRNSTYNCFSQGVGTAIITGKYQIIEGQPVVFLGPNFFANKDDYQNLLHPSYSETCPGLLLPAREVDVEDLIFRGIQTEKIPEGTGVDTDNHLTLLSLNRAVQEGDSQTRFRNLRRILYMAVLLLTITTVGDQKNPHNDFLKAFNTSFNDPTNTTTTNLQDVERHYLRSVVDLVRDCGVYYGRACTSGPAGGKCTVSL